MARFTQPLVSILVGLALAVYGLIHSATHFPRPDSLHIFWSSMPALGAVLLFLLGVMAVVSGLVLLSTGAHGLRRRYRQIQNAYGDRRGEPYDDENMHYHPNMYR